MINHLNKRQAIIALAATQKLPENDCPTDEEIKKFIYHKSNDQEADLMWEHIDSCPSCYNIWISVVKNKINIEPPPVDPPLILFIIMLIIDHIIKKRKIYISLVIIAFITPFAWKFYSQNTLEQSTNDFLAVEEQINNLYELTDNQVLKNYEFKLETTKLTFSNVVYSTHEQQAFIAGLCDGEKKLLPPEKAYFTKFINDNNKNFDKINVYYLFGKWLYGLRFNCSSFLKRNDDFFKRQSSFFEDQNSIYQFFNKKIQFIQEESLRNIFNESIFNSDYTFQSKCHTLIDSSDKVIESVLTK